MSEPRVFGSYRAGGLLNLWVEARDRLILDGLLRHGAPFGGKRVADIGCGYDARSTARMQAQAASVLLVDRPLADALKSDARVDVVEALLPEAMDLIPDASIDVLVCSAVLEHLWEPIETLAQFRRVLAPNGVALVSVPSWLAKCVLEFTAFRLGMSPEEMNDHKAYYGPRDLWPLLVRAGFLPQDIRCWRHWLGLNTFAVCRRVDRSQRRR